MKKRFVIISLVLILLISCFSPFAYAEESGTWQKNAIGWWYRYNNGSYPSNEWVRINGYWYHFDSNGYMQTGWIRDGGKWYFLSSGGAMVSGWQLISGKWYYFSSGGSMVTSWQKINGKWYYFSPGGIMQTGWLESGSNKYYLSSGGSMVTGWFLIDGIYYYFKSSGAMATSEWCEGYWLNSDGSWTYPYKASWHQISNGMWWYGDTSGWYPRDCTIKIDGVLYSFNKSGFWNNPSSPIPSLSYAITDTQFEIETSSYSDTMYYRVIIEITNTGNLPIYIKNASIDFEDNDGHLLQTDNYFSSVPDIIAPGERGYVYSNGTMSFDEGISFSNGCVLNPQLSIIEATGSLKRHQVIDTSIYNNSYGSVGCRGRIVNETDVDISYIYVIVVYYDSTGRVLDISGTSVTDIIANGTTSFDISGILMKDFSVSAVSRYVVYADEWYYQY